MALSPWTPAQRQDALESNELSNLDTRLLQPTASAEGTYSFNRSMSSRFICVAGTAAAWALALTGLIGGIYLATQLTSDQQLFDTHIQGAILPHFYPLLLNIVITAILDLTGFAHATSLKWALQREGRLSLNSNLRLLTTARSSTPNKWYFNLAMLLASISAYAASSLIFYVQRHYRSATGNTYEDKLSIIPMPVIWVGVSMLVIASVTTFILLTTTVPTWSSHPLDTVRACLDNASLEWVPGRCMLGVHSAKQPAEPTRPSTRQSSMWSANLEARRIVAGLWALTGAILVVSIVLVSLKAACKPDNAVVGVGMNTGHDMGTMAWKIVLFSAIQGLITLALHCAELIVNTSRDEHLWRLASSTPRGCKIQGYNSIWYACTNWQTIVLFLFKPIAHWFFGLAVSTNIGLQIYAEQTLYLSLVVALLAIFATAISLYRPRGPQPAAYGHLQTLSNLVDEWAGTLHWGHKTDGKVCHAGTSSSPLPPVNMNALYEGRYTIFPVIGD
ncbi:hypothetical protein LTR27_003720 [Elasticomyces elasticus]|nr:hypothetical protein LTR27_003720 [Elasticomyces elasticus]